MEKERGHQGEEHAVKFGRRHIVKEERILLSVLNGSSKIHCFRTWGLNVEGV